MCIFKRFAVAVGAVAVVASSAFAQWDYFPPKEEGGEAKLEFGYGINRLYNEVSDIELGVGARYTIIPGLEASLRLPIPLSAWDEDDSAEDYAGLAAPTIGVRYWLPMGLGFFLDFQLPIDTRKDSDEIEDWGVMTLAIGPQFSMQITDELSFGSSVGLVIPFTKELDFGEYGGKVDRTNGMELTIGVELDYSLGMVTPYVGFDMAFGLTKGKSESEGQKLEDADPPEMDIGLTLGASFDINEMFSAGVFFGMNFGDRYEAFDGIDMTTFEPKTKSYTPMVIGASFSVNF